MAHRYRENRKGDRVERRKYSQNLTREKLKDVK